MSDLACHPPRRCLMKLVVLKVYAEADDFDAQEPPADPNCFSRNFIVEVGSEGERGLERYRVTFCSPSSLAQDEDYVEHIFGRGLVIWYRPYDYQEILVFLKRNIELAEYRDWDDADEALRSWMIGEYEDLDEPKARMRQCHYTLVQKLHGSRSSSSDK
jgi:hypothetical protein